MSARRLLLLTTIAAASAVGFVFACGTGDISDLTRGYPATSPDPDAGPVDTCKHALPPPAPEAGSDDKLPIVVFAAQKMRIDSDPASDTPAVLSSPLSFDLDNTCSCAPNTKPSCTPPATKQTPCDVDGGRDNVAGPLLHGITSLSLPTKDGTKSVDSFKEDILTTDIAKGYFTLLAVVAAWNGQPNDPQVAVSLYMAAGMNTAGAVPAFDGTDVWSLADQSITDGDQQLGEDCSQGPGSAGLTKCIAKANNPFAYVVNGKLVAHFDTIPFSFGDNQHQILLPMTGAIFQATITPNSIDGELAGRWQATDILQAGANIYFDDQTTICNSPDTFGLFRSIVCGAVDLAAAPKDDGKNTKCVALSQSIHFAGGLAAIGNVAKAAANTQSDLCQTSGLPITCDGL
jgi:hypothetical protein